MQQVNNLLNNDNIKIQQCVRKISSLYKTKANNGTIEKKCGKLFQFFSTRPVKHLGLVKLIFFHILENSKLVSIKLPLTLKWLCTRNSEFFYSSVLLDNVPKFKLSLRD